jgi:hypothetical protein
VPLGPGFGRPVFRALNVVELVFTAAILVGAPVWALITLWALLAGQLAVLRPRLDRRTPNPDRKNCATLARQHMIYITMEGIKVMLTLALGNLCALRLSI